MYLFVVQSLHVVRNRRLAAWMTSFLNVFTFVPLRSLASFAGILSLFALPLFTLPSLHCLSSMPTLLSPCALALRIDNHMVKSPR